MLLSLRRTSFGGLWRSLHTAQILAARKVVHSFKLADIGEGITECEIIRWNVKPLATVEAFDPLCEVQSDKASVEITSPFDGVVKELLVQEGQVAKVGEGLCLIEVEEEGEAAVEEETHSPTLASAETKIASEPSSNDPPPPKAAAPEPRPAPTRVPHPLDPNSTATKPSIEVLATPSVRHFAKEKHLNIADVAPGSGPRGRVERRDIEAFLAGSSHAATGRDSVTLGATERLAGKEIVVPLNRTRHVMWKAMVKSLEIPHFGYSTYLDVTDLQSFLPSLSRNIPAQYLPEGHPSPFQSASSAVSPTSIFGSSHPPPLEPALNSVSPLARYTRLTLLPLLLKSLSKAMQEWPLFRSSITAHDISHPELTIRPHSDISIALSTPTGLYTPTLQQVEGMSPYKINSELRRLQALGRQTPHSGLGPKEMPKRGGTITVSNVGSIGKGEFASPILVPGGGVAILALGRARWQEDFELDENGEEIKDYEAIKNGLTDGRRRLKMGVSWSADHRVVEGAELAAFMECWRAWVENPARLIGEGR